MYINTVQQIVVAKSI